MASRYSGKENDEVPRLYGLGKSYRLPDLLVAREQEGHWGECYWVEVKWKKEGGCPGHISGKLEHGIELAFYHDYVDVQRITGIETWLCIVEGETDEELIARIDDLRPLRESRMIKDNQVQEKMGYFLRELLIPLKDSMFLKGRE